MKGYEGNGDFINSDPEQDKTQSCLWPQPMGVLPHSALLVCHCVPLALPVLFLDSRGHWQSQWHTVQLPSKAALRIKTPTVNQVET